MGAGGANHKVRAIKSSAVAAEEETEPIKTLNE
jgi:hypothetical protein